MPDKFFIAPDLQYITLLHSSSSSYDLQKVVKLWNGQMWQGCAGLWGRQRGWVFKDLLTPFDRGSQRMDRCPNLAPTHWANPTKLFFRVTHNFSFFWEQNLAVVWLKFILQILKLNNENWKTGKIKVWHDWLSDTSGGIFSHAKNERAPS